MAKKGKTVFKLQNQNDLIKNQNIKGEIKKNTYKMNKMKSKGLNPSNNNEKEKKRKV